MIPLRDNIPSRTTPVVNYLIIAATGAVFLVQLARQPDDRMVERFGMIPARVTHPGREVLIPDPQRKFREVHDARGRLVGYEEVATRHPAAPAAVPAWLTMLTCVFLHGGWLHFLGNMWFLYIFGDNVEDCFGHVGYLVFYLLAGMAASAVHWISAPDAAVPTIGASGAIAGVMGAYFLLYPRAKVLTFIPIIFFLYLITIPASVFLGIWFLIQVFQGGVITHDATGVAWWAHIGGFVFGAAVAWILSKTHYARPTVHERYDDHSRSMYAPRSPWG